MHWTLKTWLGSLDHPLRQVTLDRSRAIDGVASKPVGQLINQPRNILNAPATLLLLPLQRLCQRHHQSHRFNAKSGVNRVQPPTQQPHQMACIARGAHGPNADRSNLIVHALKQQVDMPGAEADMLHLLANRLNQRHDGNCQRLSRQQRFQKRDPALKRVFRRKWLQRFPHMPIRLIQP